jgi:D-alanine--poly(phosphoribitol) ligase subunit 2
MNRSDLVELISASVRDVTARARPTQPDSIGEETRLFGSKGLLDSLGLVTVVCEVEQEVSDQLDVIISIADDRAMSLERSPFRTVGMLADYVLTLLDEQNGNRQRV